MMFLPIVGRELLEGSRKRRTYWNRVVVAALGLLVGCWVLLIPDFRAPAMVGQALFLPLSVILYLHSMMVGAFRTADCLSEEKRDGTLGLLFLTDLKGHDIVLGKLASNSLAAFYGSLAMVPVLAIPLLAGGVTVGEFWRVVIVALNTQFFSLVTGLFCSSVSRDDRWAMGGTIFILLLFIAGFPLAAGICSDVQSLNFLTEFLLIPSPGYAGFTAFEAVFKAPMKFNHFYLSVLFTHVLSWGLLVAASIAVRRSWQDKVLHAGIGRNQGWWQRLRFGDWSRRLRNRRHQLSINPYYWLMARHRLRGLGLWLALLLGGLFWAFGLIFYPTDWKEESVYVATSIVTHFLLKVWVTLEASRPLSLDRQSGALELLLSTPLPVREIIRGLLMGLERRMIGPVFLVLVADVIFIVASRRSTEMVVLGIGWVLLLLADLVTLSWLGMWRGLNNRRPNRAAALAVAQVLVLPWILFALIMTALSWMQALGYFKGFRDPSEYSFFGLGFGVFLLVDFFFFFEARQGLLNRFREVACGRFRVRRRYDNAPAPAEHGQA